jgi:hydrogenase maturation protease
MSSETDKVLVVGVGNALLGDEGLGVHVARSLLAAKASLPAHVEVFEAGTSLFDLLPEMSRYSRVIIVDAVRAGQEPGTVYRSASLAEAADEPETTAPISLHQWGLAETLRAAKMLGMLPQQLLLVGAEPENISPGTELSPKLARAAERIVSLVVAEASAVGEPDRS